MPKIQIIFISTFLFFFIACNEEQKASKTLTQTPLEANASEENYHLAQKHFNEGEYEKALAFDLKQLEEDLKYYEAMSLEIALDYNNIGLDYDELKKPKKALEYYLKTMKIDNIRLEENSTERSSTYFNIATTYNNLGEYAKAIDYYLKALKIDEKSLGKEHPEVLAEYESLAIVYGNFLKPNLSLKYWKKSLGYKEKKYGKYSLESNETREEVSKLEERLMKKIK